MARPSVDRRSLRVDDEALIDSRPGPLSLWCSLPCLDQGTGAASAPLPVDVVVHTLALLRVFDLDCGCPGAGHCELVGGPPLAEVVVVGGLAAPRVLLISPLADGTEVDQALLLAAAERAGGVDCWRVAGSLLLILELVVLTAVLGPPTLRAPSSPSTLFEPEADRPVLLPVGRLTFGGSLSPWSHKDPLSSAQPSAPAALS